MASPDPYDFLDIGSLLSEEEKLLRATVRRFTEEKILPEVGSWWEEGTFPKELAKEMGALGLARHASRGLRMCRYQRHGLRSGLHRTRGGRLGHAIIRVGPRVPGDVPDLGIRIGGAETDLAAREWPPERSSAASA